MRTDTIIIKAAVAVALALMPLCTAAQTVRGDFNMDGQVNISDVTSFINYLLSGKPAQELPDCYETVTVNGVSFVMVMVQGGTYMRELGTSWTVDDFSIGQTEVTIELWNAVMGGTPQDNMMSFPQNPVEYVSWDDCQEFIAQLNALTGRTFRLPSDSEWEYAACGGRLTLAYTYAGSNDINEVAWYRGNIPALDPNVPYSYVTRTQPVATKLPNELGLYDMSGNVEEWCQSNRLTPGLTDSSALRGGSADPNCNDNGACCKVTSNKIMPHDRKDRYIGFRLAL